jgi:carbon monoxide dehydrogenase subunit G
MANLKIEERFTVDAPLSAVWAFLLDPAQVAACLPGARLDGKEGEDTYLGTMKVKVGPVASEFRGKATMSDVDAGAHSLKLSGSGEDKGGGGSARLIMSCRVAATAAGSEVHIDAEVDLAGKLVRFGRGLIEGVSKQLFKQFVERARARLSAAAPAPTGDATAAPAPTGDATAAPAAPAATSAEGRAGAEPAASPSVVEAAPAAAPAAESPPAAAMPAASATPPVASEPLVAPPPATPEPVAVSAPAAAPAVAPAPPASAPEATPAAALPIAAPATAPAAPAAPPSPLAASAPANDEALDAGALLWRTFRSWLAGWLRRLFRRAAPK